MSPESERATMKTITRVAVTVEVIDTQPWNDETTTGHIYKRAKEHARLQVENAIRGEKYDQSGHLRIIGEPHVSLVMTEDK